MGYHNGKIIAYDTRSRNCRKCALAHNKNDHDCRQNYKGSAKGMEQDMAIGMILNNELFEKHKVFLARLIMDDDSSTIAALNRVSSYKIEKWSDQNHACKNFKGDLRGLKLSEELKEYFYSNFRTAISENKGNAKGLEACLKSIIPHAFGDHESCTFHEKNEKYEYKNIPGKKPLEGIQLQGALQDVIDRYIAKVDMLAPAGSTQANEAFNHTVASFCPKSKHYSDSESFNFRVAAAVCQKNKGPNFLSEVYEKLGASPTSKKSKYREKKGKKNRKTSNISKN